MRAFVCSRRGWMLGGFTNHLKAELQTKREFMAQSSRAQSA
jgi:hypothetical protein